MNIEGYVSSDRSDGEEYFALRVHGDSMNAARIFEGDVLLVRKQSIVDNGDIAVILVNGDCATVKKFYKTKNTVTLVPASTNPIHQLQIYDLGDTPISVIGKVVEVRTLL